MAWGTLLAPSLPAQLRWGLAEGQGSECRWLMAGVYTATNRPPGGTGMTELQMPVSTLRTCPERPHLCTSHPSLSACGCPWPCCGLRPLILALGAHKDRVTAGLRGQITCGPHHNHVIGYCTWSLRVTWYLQVTHSF